jgi:DNA ligase-1
MSSKREYVQLSHPYNAKKHYYAGWFWSEKLDGQRAIWDGGISRGLPCSEVPYANTAKHDRFLKTQVATGLWSRYGQPIYAPKSFLDRLPLVPLDGELYIGRGKFQQTVSTTKTQVPGFGWNAIRYRVFDAPPLSSFLMPGLVQNPNITLLFTLEQALWASKRILELGYDHAKFIRILPFVSVVPYLKALLDGNEIATYHPQEQLPTTTAAAMAKVESLLDELLPLKAEGLILRNPNSKWTPKRVHDSIKIKPYLDMEGTVTGYIWGRETDKGSKLLGLMGALVLQLDSGKRLELSGFTDAERQMTFDSGGDMEEGHKYPGEAISGAWTHKLFPIGSRVTIKYRELSDDGIPKEARYFRPHPGV